ASYPLTQAIMSCSSWPGLPGSMSVSLSCDQPRVACTRSAAQSACFWVRPIRFIVSRNARRAAKSDSAGERVGSGEVAGLGTGAVAGGAVDGGGVSTLSADAESD